MQGQLIPCVFGHVFSELTTDITGLLEQQILSCEFNQVHINTSGTGPLSCMCSHVIPLSQLGGVQLDKDLRALTGYFSSCTNWPVRDKFSRLMQIATLLTMETVSL